jgi:hypothetical protein
MRTNFAPMVGLVKTRSSAAREKRGLNKATRVEIRIIRKKAYFIGLYSYFRIRYPFYTLTVDKSQDMS